MKRVPKYYLTEQRWLLAFAAFVFTGMGSAFCITVVYRLLKDPTPTWRFLRENPGPAVMPFAMLGFGLWLCWVCIRWKKWVVKIATADKLFGYVSSRHGILNWVFSGMREKGGTEPVDPETGKPSKRYLKRQLKRRQS